MAPAAIHEGATAVEAGHSPVLSRLGERRHAHIAISGHFRRFLCASPNAVPMRRTSRDDGPGMPGPYRKRRFCGVIRGVSVRPVGATHAWPVVGIGNTVLVSEIRDGTNAAVAGRRPGPRRQAHGGQKPTNREGDTAPRRAGAAGGAFAVSREAVGALQFATFAALLGWFGAGYCFHIMESTRYLFRTAFTAENHCGGTDACDAPAPVPRFPARSGWPAGCCSPSAWGLNSPQRAWGFPPMGWRRTSNASILSRLRELPRQNIPSLVQAVVLLPLFAGAVYGIVRDNWDALLAMPLQAVEKSSLQMAVSVLDLIWKGAMLFLVLGAIDLVRQNRRYIGGPAHEQAGDPRRSARRSKAIRRSRARIRRLQRECARRQMMKQVPDGDRRDRQSDALRGRDPVRQSDAMAAPTVVAKGKNYLALRIRQKAIEHQVPIIENPPLAQALYKSVEVGQEIPPHLYRAVAEILAYIFRLIMERPSAGDRTTLGPTSPSGKRTSAAAGARAGPARRAYELRPRWRFRWRCSASCWR